MDAERTPGPWNWQYYPEGRKLLLGPHRAVLHCLDAPITVRDPDAILISAAPDLLEACEALLNSTWMNRLEAMQAIRAAVAKARGENAP